MKSSFIATAPMRFTTALATLSLMGCGGQSGAIQPGMWETNMNMAAGTAELWSSSSQRCIYEEEAANPGRGLVKVGPLSHCAASKSQFANGRFSVEATCPERPSAMASVPMTPDWLASRIALRGTYDQESMEGTVEAELEDTIEPIKFNGKLTARRIGDC